MKFDLHLSRNYKGDPYHWPLDAESAGEVRWWIQDFWEFSELTMPTTEALLYVDVGKLGNLQMLATITYDSNGMLTCLLNAEDAVTSAMLVNFGYTNGSLIKGNESFERLIGCLFRNHSNES